MEILFDGYCPESLLKGDRVEMRLNEDDFWESEATGLQMTIFPPFATILRWRGNGKFRASSDVASNLFTGLVITEAQKDEGQEIFPDEKNIIETKFELDWYLHEVYDSKNEFDAAKFNPNDPVFEKQKIYLDTITKEDRQNLIDLYETVKGQSSKENFMKAETFSSFHEKIYEMKLVFNFNWMSWDTGKKNIMDTNFDFSNCSLLDISMYLTTIFRADRFSDGTIEENFRNGTLEKIFNTLREGADLNYSSSSQPQ